jgi:hypothetical protein
MSGRDGRSETDHDRGRPESRLFARPVAASVRFRTTRGPGIDPQLASAIFWSIDRCTLQAAVRRARRRNQSSDIRGFLAATWTRFQPNGRSRKKARRALTTQKSPLRSSNRLPGSPWDRSSATWCPPAGGRDIRRWRRRAIRRPPQERLSKRAPPVLVPAERHPRFAGLRHADGSARVRSTSPADD